MRKSVNEIPRAGEAPPAPTDGAIPNAAPAVVTDAGMRPAPAATESVRARLDSIDLLRGLVMVIMMLDHTRDFFHFEMLNFDPTDLTRTTPQLFLTRWVTHFCAPVFVFLAGTGAYLQLARGKSRAELSRFLVTRGLWLIVLELTVVRLLFEFSFDYRILGTLQVIWAIGVSMIALAALIRLPLRAIAVCGVLMIALHNLFDGVQATVWRGPGTPAPNLWESLWMILHQQGLIQILGGPVLFVLYPLIPWVGVMAAGYAFGALYQLPAERRRRILFALGGALTLAFIVNRATNLYGDPQSWAGQPSALFTALSFLNLTKYPPSLLYLLMTLGPAMMALAWFERTGRGPLSRALITFGRVPLFFYLWQWLTAHALAVIVGYLAGQPVGWQFVSPIDKPSPNPGNLGFDLWVVYVFWALGVMLLYPLCRWFAGVKQRRRDWWLSYL